MFGSLQSREVIAAAAIAVVLAPGYALVGSTPETGSGTDTPATTASTSAPKASRSGKSSDLPVAGQPRSSEFLAASRAIPVPMDRGKLFRPVADAQSRPGTENFSRIPTRPVVVNQSGSAEIKAFAQALMTARHMPPPVRRTMRSERRVTAPIAAATVAPVVRAPGLPVRPRKRASYPVLLTRHPDGNATPEIVVASRSFGPPQRHVPFPHGAVPAKTANATLAAVLKKDETQTVATPRVRAKYPLLQRRHPNVQEDYPVRLAALPPGAAAGALVGMRGHQTRSLPPALLARHPVQVQTRVAITRGTQSRVLASLPTRPRSPSVARPFMPELPRPSGNVRSNLVGATPRIEEPATRPYIPWATRQQQAQAVRTGPVHGNPHLVPHVAPFVSEHKPGTIVVHVKEKRLYLVQSNTTARVYPIGTAHGALDVLGQTRVTTRRHMPTWTPTPNQRRRDPTLPRRVEAGPENPLGVRAIGLGWRYRLIHGTSDPSSIGYARSDGCIRMLNDDVVDLFRRVKVGNRVLVLASAASPLTEWRPAGYQEYKPRKRWKRRKWRKKRTRSSRRYASRRAKRRR